MNSRPDLAGAQPGHRGVGNTRLARRAAGAAGEAAGWPPPS